jgi:putative methionine-R-sulfoxide reductase with GAF domain
MLTQMKAPVVVQNGIMHVQVVADVHAFPGHIACASS